VGKETIGDNKVPRDYDSSNDSTTTTKKTGDKVSTDLGSAAVSAAGGLLSGVIGLFSNPYKSQYKWKQKSIDAAVDRTQALLKPTAAWYNAANNSTTSMSDYQSLLNSALKKKSAMYTS
jgi:hypothetical protein